MSDLFCEDSSPYTSQDNERNSENLIQSQLSVMERFEKIKRERQSQLKSERCSESTNPFDSYRKVSSESQLSTQFKFTQRHSTFVPNINIRSRNMVRDQSVDSILYEDAVRRMNKDYQSPRLSSVSSVNRYSEYILKEKLKREFNKHFRGVESYQDFLSLLKSLGFIKEDSSIVSKAWDIVNENNQPSKQRTLDFILCVMNSSFNSTYNKEEAQIIHSYFRELYENKRNSYRGIKQLERYSFSPRISQNSHVLAKNVVNKRVEDFGSASIQYLNSSVVKKEDLSTRKEEKELENCTFYPKVNKSSKVNNNNRHLALYELSKKEPPKKQTTEEVQLQESLSECYFRPQLVDPVISILPKKEVIQQVVDRLSKPKNPVRKKGKKETVLRKKYSPRENLGFLSPRTVAKKLMNNNALKLSRSH